METQSAPARARKTRLIADDRGATAIEYGLILMLIAASMIVAFSVFAEQTVGLWTGVNDKVAAAK